MTKHGIEFVQLFHAPQQFRQVLLQFADAGPVCCCHFLLFLRDACGSLAMSTIRFSRFGKKLVQRRIERADHHRETVHGFKKSGKIFALHRQKLLERFPAASSRRAQESSPA